MDKHSVNDLDNQGSACGVLLVTWFTKRQKKSGLSGPLFSFGQWFNPADRILASNPPGLADHVQQ